MWCVDLLNFWEGWVRLPYDTEEEARKIFALNSGNDGRSELNKIIILRNPEGDIVEKVDRGNVW